MIRKLLIANRGEIAIRIMRTADELGMATVAVAPADDEASLHMRRAGEAVVLMGTGPAAYLDGDQILAIARDRGCDAIHPGYGFLSENAAFAGACAAAGIRFVGPTSEQLAMLGDKAAARRLAERCEVPILAGTGTHVSPEEALAFMARIDGPVMLKAVAGGGGRGIRLVADPEDLGAAFERCASEARRAFGDERVYVEQALLRARHIEVQLLGDGSGAVMDLGERDCTLQRRHQKIVEIAPAPSLSEAVRSRLIGSARRMASEIGYLNAGTFEFLVDADGTHPAFYFLEANPRIQVEHTITEELWGVDIVQAQLRLAAGDTLDELGLGHRAPRAGFAIQARVNMERLLADGMPVMDGGSLTTFDPPTGPGIRVDTYAYRGYQTNVAYDSLLAKLIVGSGSSYAAALGKADRALGEFAVRGVSTNIGLLRALLRHSLVRSDAISTRFIDENLAELLEAAAHLEPAIAEPDDLVAASIASATQRPLPSGAVGLSSPVTGVVVGLLASVGDAVAEGQPVLVVEAMKMEHVLPAPAAGMVQELRVDTGAAVSAGQILGSIAPDEGVEAMVTYQEDLDLGHVRDDVAEALRRNEAVADSHRPGAVARRHAKQARTARENIADLCDSGTFVEYGALVVAAQRARRSMEELVDKTPADGVVVGFGDVNGSTFDRERAQALVIAFDETVLAGTMGEMAREKLKHCLEVARQARRPVVLFAEGGGGRAGDTDLRLAVTGWTMDVSSYYQLGRMSGLTPLVGMTSGRCFAANAGMLACCDVIIATEGSNIGVGGPSMIEGGRLGTYQPEEIGPSHVQSASGVIDILVSDEAAGVAAAKRYLSYFQGTIDAWEAHDQRALRFTVPENRLRAYDVRKAIELIADKDSLLELRRGFGAGIVTGLLRVEGRPLGVIANNPLHLGGAIDADAAHKASRFMRLCEAFRLPILMLCDTPGMMVGPEAEKTATVRAMGRMFITGANLSVPFFTIVLRKAYGIGAELMAGGWFRAPRFTVSWPTGEFGGMNIEGNVKLAHAAEMAAIPDLAERQAFFDRKVAEMLATGRALAVATHNEIDAVIDPADSRHWIATAMAAHRDREPGADKSVPFVDPW